MKLRMLSILGLSCAVALSASAQDYDDIYYDSSQDETVVESAEKQSQTAVSEPVQTSSNNIGDESNVWHSSNIVDLRDVDEYNRQGDYFKMPHMAVIRFMWIRCLPMAIHLNIPNV